LRYRLQ